MLGLYEAWSEHDYNPFILFDQNEKIISLNQEAQYLLGEASNKEIFNITKTYANHNFGFKTTIIDLSFGSYKFYALTVGYIDEEKIGIKLYKKPAKKFAHVEEYGEDVNIYTLLDLCTSAAATMNKSQYLKEFDPTFPEIRLKINFFTKLLNKIYQAHKNNDVIKIILSLKTGEFIKFKNKKYPIFAIKIISKNIDKSLEKDIEQIASECNCAVIFQDGCTTISSAMVTN